MAAARSNLAAPLPARLESLARADPASSLVTAHLGVSLRKIRIVKVGFESSPGV